MPLDKFGKRAEDNGNESSIVKLARIDENVKFLKAGAEAVRIQLDRHEIKDDKTFKEINDKQNKTHGIICWASGGLAVFVFIIEIIFKH